MASQIDYSVPVFGDPTTQSVRDQFEQANIEITELQNRVWTLEQNPVVPAGGNRQVQINDNGSFGATDKFFLGDDNVLNLVDSSGTRNVQIGSYSDWGVFTGVQCNGVLQCYGFQGFEVRIYNNLGRFTIEQSAAKFIGDSGVAKIMEINYLTGKVGIGTYGWPFPDTYKLDVTGDININDNGAGGFSYRFNGIPFVYQANDQIVLTNIYSINGQPVGGGGSAAGQDDWVQFNSGGGLDAVETFQYDDEWSWLTLGTINGQWGIGDWNGSIVWDEDYYELYLNAGWGTVMVDGSDQVIKRYGIDSAKEPRGRRPRSQPRYEPPPFVLDSMLTLTHGTQFSGWSYLSFFTEQWGDSWIQAHRANAASTLTLNPKGGEVYVGTRPVGQMLNDHETRLSNMENQLRSMR